MRIGEVAEQTGLSISNIRFYERKGLIAPDREQDSKYRDYTSEDVNRLKQIILYRKMDFPIETISLLIRDNGISVEPVLEEQITNLLEKQQMIQGSIDLCKKIVEDQAYKDMDIDYYLQYVKEEEQKGVRFADINEMLDDFTTFTQLGRLFGYPFAKCNFQKQWMNRVVQILWCMMWISIPLIGIIDELLDQDGVSIRMIIFWIIWIIVFVTSFVIFRRGKKKM